MRISVVGLGKLGLPLSGILARAGHQVIGADVNTDSVALINEGVSPINETGLAELLRKVDIVATTDVAAAVAQTDVTFVVVPTPSGGSTGDDEFSNWYVLEAMEAIGLGIQSKTTEHTVVLTSTVMPGASTKYIIPRLELASGRKIGEKLNFAYSPEFIALGSVIADMYHPDFVLIGQANPQAGNILSLIYRSYLSDPHVQISRVSLIDAEIAKLALNCYLTVKISFANMLSEYCEIMTGSDAATVCRLIGHDTRIGSKYLRPGTAAAGPCLPRDLRAFHASMWHNNIQGEIIEAAISINDRQVARLKNKVMAFKPRRAAVLGMAYKPGTAVTDASVGFALVAKLWAAGVETAWYDPLVPGGMSTAQDAIQGADVVVITTPDPTFGMVNYGGITVLDCWDVAHQGTNIIKQGQNDRADLRTLYS